MVTYTPGWANKSQTGWDLRAIRLTRWPCYRRTGDGWFQLETGIWRHTLDQNGPPSAPKG